MSRLLRSLANNVQQKENELKEGELNWGLGGGGGTEFMGGEIRGLARSV